MALEKLIDWNNRLSESEIDALLKKQHKQRPTIKELMAMPYDTNYLPAQSRTHLSYKAGSTDAIITQDGKSEKIKIPQKSGEWRKCDKKYGIPIGELSSASDPEAKRFWRFQNRDFCGLLVRDGVLVGRRDVNACYGPGNIRFGVLATRISKRNEEKDVALDKLKAYAKKSKWAKEILRRLKGCE